MNKRNKIFIIVVIGIIIAVLIAVIIVKNNEKNEAIENNVQQIVVEKPETKENKKDTDLTAINTQISEIKVKEGEDEKIKVANFQNEILDSTMKEFDKQGIKFSSFYLSEITDEYCIFSINVMNVNNTEKDVKFDIILYDQNNSELMRYPVEFSKVGVGEKISQEVKYYGDGSAIKNLRIEVESVV